MPPNSDPLIPGNKFFRFFFHGLFITGLIPFLPAVFLFLPENIAGFNYTGWAWMAMLAVTLITLPAIRRIGFPLLFWLPWIIYLIVYIIVDFSFPGLQLTLQYLLPLMIGVTVSGFTYSPALIQWLGKRAALYFSVITILSLIYIAATGFSPQSAAVPMILSVAAALLISLFSVRKKIIYLVLFFLLLVIPVTMITRMGIVSFLLIFVLNFANRNLMQKLLFLALGIPLGLVIFYSPSFQNKTFNTGEGKIKDISINYYQSEKINSSGRTTWYLALESGIARSPVWGNGPRSDNFAFKEYGFKSGEGHNDYLTVRYNYGWVGLCLLLLGLAGQFYWLWTRRRRYRQSIRLFIVWSAVMTLFFSFLAFMYTDNILKYTIFFPNLFFAMTGILSGSFISEDSPVLPETNVSL